jgi:DNA helicase-2/ATP-dependent DNA helicase PcrA
MSINSDDPEDAIEEERRLCYVGITRAEKRLVMTAARQRMVNGENRYSKLSRFIYEVPATLLNMQGTEGPSQRRREGNLSFESDYESGENGYRGKYSFQNGFSGGFSKQSSYSGRADRYTDNGSGWQNGGRKRNFGDHSWENSGDGYYPFGNDPWEKVFDLDKEKHEEVVRFGSKPVISKGSQIIDSGGATDYGVGDRVTHVKFGEGTVLQLEKAARDYEVTVQFDTAGKKRMYAAFAKLKRI